jgi:hypothetical protein
MPSLVLIEGNIYQNTKVLSSKIVETVNTTDCSSTSFGINPLTQRSDELLLGVAAENYSSEKPVVFLRIKTGKYAGWVTR